MSVRTEERTRRRRRTPEAAQREIIESAEQLLRERPFRELTVDEVMQRTGLSRPSFYVYFKDRHDLVLKVFEHIGSELATPTGWWYDSRDDGRMRLTDAISGVVAVFAEHGRVLRALADAAADDPDVEHAYASLVQTFIDQTRLQIEEEMAAGNVPPLDAHQVSTALTWMTERYLYLTLGNDPNMPQEPVAETLRTIWIRTLYG